MKQVQYKKVLEALEELQDRVSAIEERIKPKVVRTRGDPVVRMN